MYKVEAVCVFFKHSSHYISSPSDMFFRQLFLVCCIMCTYGYLHTSSVHLLNSIRASAYTLITPHIIHKTMSGM